MDRKDLGILLPCRVNGVLLQWDPDSGSDLTIISVPQYNSIGAQLGAKPKLKPIQQHVSAFNRTPIKFAGYFEATLSSESTSMVEKVYVLETDFNHQPLLGKVALFTLGYMKFCPKGSFARANYVNAVVNASFESSDLTEAELKVEVEKLHKEFQCVFSGVGCFKGFEVELQVREGSTPFILRAAQCPIHLRPQALHRDHLVVMANITKPCQSLPKRTLKCPDFKSGLKNSKSFGLHVKNCI